MTLDELIKEMAVDPYRAGAAYVIGTLIGDVMPGERERFREAFHAVLIEHGPQVIANNFDFTTALVELLRERGLYDKLESEVAQRAAAKSRTIR